MAGKKAKSGLLADLAAEVAAKSARRTLRMLTDEQLAELDAAIDEHPQLSAHQFCDIVQSGFGVTVGRTSMIEHLRRRKSHGAR